MVCLDFDNINFRGISSNVLTFIKTLFCRENHLQSSIIVQHKNRLVPISLLGRGHFPPRILDPLLPRLPPLDDNSYGSGNVKTASSDLPSRPNTVALSMDDEIFCPLLHNSDELFWALLCSRSPDERGKILVASGRNKSKGDV